MGIYTKGQAERFDRAKEDHELVKALQALEWDLAEFEHESAKELRDKAKRLIHVLARNDDGIARRSARAMVKNAAETLRKERAKAKRATR